MGSIIRGDVIESTDVMVPATEPAPAQTEKKEEEEASAQPAEGEQKQD